MSSLNISLEDFIDRRNDSISLKIYDSTSYSLFAIKKILQTYNNEGFDNVDYFDFSKDKKIEDLIALFNTYPYMSSYRYVIISGINEKDSEIIDKITNYLLNPMKTTKHIFILANNKTDLLTEHTLTEDNSGDAIIKFIKGKMCKSEAAKNCIEKGWKIQQGDSAWMNTLSDPLPSTFKEGVKKLQKYLAEKEKELKAQKATVLSLIHI